MSVMLLMSLANASSIVQQVRSLSSNKSVNDNKKCCSYNADNGNIVSLFHSCLELTTFRYQTVCWLGYKGENFTVKKLIIMKRARIAAL